MPNKASATRGLNTIMWVIVAAMFLGGVINDPGITSFCIGVWLLFVAFIGSRGEDLSGDAHLIIHLMMGLGTVFIIMAVVQDTRGALILSSSILVGTLMYLKEDINVED